MNYEDDLYPLGTFVRIAAENRTVSPETLAALMREENVEFAALASHNGLSLTKHDATRTRRAARLVVQRRIRGTA